MKAGNFKLTLEIVDDKPVITIVIPCNTMEEVEELLNGIKNGLSDLVKEKE